MFVVNPQCFQPFCVCKSTIYSFSLNLEGQKRRCIIFEVGAAPIALSFPPLPDVVGGQTCKKQEDGRVAHHLSCPCPSPISCPPPTKCCRYHQVSVCKSFTLQSTWNALHPDLPQIKAQPKRYSCNVVHCTVFYATGIHFKVLYSLLNLKFTQSV